MKRSFYLSIAFLFITTVVMAQCPNGQCKPTLAPKPDKISSNEIVVPVEVHVEKPKIKKPRKCKRGRCSRRS